MGCSKMSDGRNKGKEVLEKLKVLEKEIKELKKQIAEGTGSGVDPEIQQDVEQNTANIATNTANISTNTANIATNTSDISTNTSDISTNTANISTNTSNIATKQDELTAGNGIVIDGSNNISVSLGTSTLTGMPHDTQINTVSGALFLGGSSGIVALGNTLNGMNKTVKGIQNLELSPHGMFRMMNSSMDGIHSLDFRYDMVQGTGIYYLYPGLFFWRMFNSQRFGDKAHYDEPSSSRHCCSVRYKFDNNGTSLVGKKEHLMDNSWSDKQYYPPANGVTQSTQNVNFQLTSHPAQHPSGGSSSNRLQFNYSDSYLPPQGFLWHVGIIDLSYSAYGIKDRYMVEITKRMDDMIEMWVNNKYIGGGSHSTGSGDFRKRIICVVGKYLYFDAMWVDEGGARNYFLEFKVREGWNMS